METFRPPAISAPDKTERNRQKKSHELLLWGSGMVGLETWKFEKSSVSWLSEKQQAMTYISR